MNRKIYINGRFLSHQITGVQQFATEICRYLRAPDIEFILLVPPHIAVPELFSHMTVKTIGKRSGYLWEQMELPFYLKKAGAPLLLNFCNTAPLFYYNQWVAIHDLAFIHHPEWFSKSFARVYRFLIPRIVRHSKKILTVSNTIKEQLQQILDVPADKINILYNGISNDLLHHKESVYTAREKIILTVSSINPRKNLKTLVEAFIMGAFPGYELVIAGAKNHVFGKTYQGMEQDPHIRYTGYISNQELIDLYQRSSLFVSLSLDEGFGIPVLESLYHGCPVLLSDISVYRECFGDIARFTSAEDTARVSADMQKALSSTVVPANINKLSAKYNYEESSKKLIKMLRETSEKM